MLFVGPDCFPPTCCELPKAKIRVLWCTIGLETGLA